MKSKAKVAIFASGRGSNARKIVEFSEKESCHYSVECIVSNKRDADVLKYAQSKEISHKFFTREAYKNEETLLEYLFDHKVNLIILAGFLWLIPRFLVQAFPNKIINIHPALLPRYGGKGMYGQHVHKAVAENKDPASGITIHYVNEKYDDGQIIFQAQCQLDPDNSAEDIAAKVLKLEHRFYPEVVNGVASLMA